MNPELRHRVSGIALIVILIIWPVSTVTFAQDEPQTILHLTFLNIALTAFGNWVTTKNRQERPDQEKP